MYHGNAPSAVPLTAAQMLAGDNRFGRLDGLNEGAGLLKNGFINPSFDHWQRGPIALAGFGADRWQLILAGDGTVSHQQSALGATEAPSESRFCCRVSAANRQTGAMAFAQKIEGVRRFAGKRVRLSGLARASAALNIGYYYEQGFGTGGSAAVTVSGGNFPLSTVYTPFSMIIDVPSIAGKTIGTIGDYLAMGLITTALGTFTIDLLDLEVKEVIIGYGDQVPPFERVPREMDLVRCQRFYERIGLNQNAVLLDAYASVAGMNAALPVSMKATKRTNPTVSISSVFLSNLATQSSAANLDYVQITWIAQAVGRFYAQAGANSYIELNAEI